MRPEARRVTVLLSFVLVSSAALAQTIRTLSEPAEIRRTLGPVRGRDVNVTLDVKYADSEIDNPTTGTADQVHLRTYNGGLVGPTIRVHPGDVLNVHLINSLPNPDPSCQASAADPNLPNCFNTTNLHTHGLHVSPAGNSDNVLLSIGPGAEFGYIFTIPKDHPAGTFWYHSHRHGSTALQVSSGMVGALIVEGDRPIKDKPANGIADVDTVLKYPGGRAFDEHVMVFEQIAYACGKPGAPVNWDCTGAVGTIEQYGAQFGPGTWPGSGRYTLINGAVQPTWTATTGRIQRWRLIHGGVRDTVLMTIVKAKPRLLANALTSLRRMSLAAQANWVSDNCLADQPLPVWEFAADGLTRRAFSEKTVNTLQPGYRSDVLALFNQPGTYCVLDDKASALQTVNQQAKDRRLLGLVQVSGPSIATAPRDYLRQQLIAANADLPASVKREIDALSLVSYAPHAPIPAGDGIGHQALSFFIDTTPKPPTFEIDGHPYDPDRIDRTLTLGATDEWTLTSKLANHPFHIHVNPFEIEEIRDAGGQSIFDSTGKCIDKNPDGTLDTQYCDQIGVFRDTIFTKQDYTITLRTHYETFTGEFVLHCHILDHEDQGMMQNVLIAPKGVMTTMTHKR